ncbi:unnamed protein product [Ilex paraguariensis]|uniref:Protein FAR1-RELATED SEQUENCE n=1 Tax=Ilex paraguariensis TaxID=185542 RepID=A0ABC8SJ68_9AQUA
MGIDLEQPSVEHHKDDSRPNESVNMEDAGGEVRNNDGATVCCPKIIEHNREKTVPSVRGCTSNSENQVHSGGGVAVNSHQDLEPRDGMEFESKEDAFSFYKEYAKSVGFATIIKASRRSRISGKFIDAKFVCTRYGSKRDSVMAETPEPVSNADGIASIPVKRKRGRINRSWSKTDCKACMHVKRRQDGIWIIHSFKKEHNHEIFPDQAYYFRGHRNIELGNSNVDALHAIRARTKKMYVTMSKQSGGMKKVENQKSGTVSVSGQHLALEEGDAQVMLEHFMYMQDENPNFFHAIDLNQDLCLRNVFWVDAKARLDYGNFGDVVFFDTTYIKNEYKLPFASFIGVNHHCQFLLLGCALIADESKSTYIWVMQAWLRAMGGQAPKVILTDQDITLKEAIAEVFPNSRHCFCLWHILSKIQEKLSYVMRQHGSFLSKFNKCILKSGTDEQFEKRWWKMCDRFELRNDVWFQSLYEDRERWIPTYMRDIFLAGMSTAQRLESITSFLDKCIQRKTTLKEFLDQYKAILQEKYEEEAKADFETWHKQPGLKSPSPFGKQMATMYTHAIFKKFQVEVLGVVACHPKKESEDGDTITFKVQDFEENQDFIVVWNETTSDITCSCHLFEFNGFLCRHVMIVLQILGVHNIPSQYILKRWTKDAKNRGPMRQTDIIESRFQRYTELCRRAFKLGDEGSLSQESYNIAFHALEEALRKCETVNNSTQSVLEPSSPSTHGLHDFEEVTQGNCTSKTQKKNNVSGKPKVTPELEAITIGMHSGWQQMGNTNLRAPARDCSYESQQGIQVMEQLNSRISTFDGYLATQQIVQGMGQVNMITPSRDDSYSDQPSMQGLGQLSSIAPIHDGHYLAQQRLHGLVRLSNYVLEKGLGFATG